MDESKSAKGRLDRVRGFGQWGTQPDSDEDHTPR